MSKSRWSLWRSLRRQLRTQLVKPESQCAFCGRADVFLTIDHKLPKSWNGGHGEDNLQLLCTPCVELKNQKEHKLTKAVMGGMPLAKAQSDIQAWHPQKQAMASMIAKTERVNAWEREWRRGFTLPFTRVRLNFIMAARKRLPRPEEAVHSRKEEK